MMDSCPSARRGSRPRSDPRAREAQAKAPWSTRLRKLNPLRCGRAGSRVRTLVRVTRDRRAGPPLASAAFGGSGTVLVVSLDDLPGWLPAWCLEHLGSEPVEVLFGLEQISMVFGLRLADGRDVVVKARADDGRAAACVAAQAQLAERGFPCARPLTPAGEVGSLAVHAEALRPSGVVLEGDSPEVAVRPLAGWTEGRVTGASVAAARVVPWTGLLGWSRSQPPVTTTRPAPIAPRCVGEHP